MELLFVMIGGAILGMIARYSAPQRTTHGSLLVPAIGSAVAGIVWAGLTRLGWRFDGGWIWVVSLLLAAAVATLAGVILGRRRTASDSKLLTTLIKA